MFDFFVCPFVSNKPQNGWTNRAQMFCGNSQYPRNGLWTVHSINITHGNVDLNYFINLSMFTENSQNWEFYNSEEKMAAW